MTTRTPRARFHSRHSRITLKDGHSPSFNNVATVVLSFGKNCLAVFFKMSIRCGGTYSLQPGCGTTGKTTFTMRTTSARAFHSLMLQEDHGRLLSEAEPESSMTVRALGRSSIYYGSTASGFNVSLLRIQAIPILLQRLAPLCRRPLLFVSIRMAGFRTRSSTVFLWSGNYNARQR